MCRHRRHSVGLRLSYLTENTCYGRRRRRAGEQNQNGNVCSQRRLHSCLFALLSFWYRFATLFRSQGSCQLTRQEQVYSVSSCYMRILRIILRPRREMLLRPSTFPASRGRGRLCCAGCRRWRKYEIDVQTRRRCRRKGKERTCHSKRKRRLSEAKLALDRLFGRRLRGIARPAHAPSILYF